MKRKVWKLPRVMALALLLLAGAMEAKAKEVDWAKIVPALEGATSVGELTECLECHEEYIKSFEKTKHSGFFKHADAGTGIACEKCHGPMSKHLAEAPGLLTSDKKPTVVSFGEISHNQKNMICEQCHTGGMQIGWKGSPHQRTGVSCVNCHYVMERRSDKSLFVSENATKACVRCHSDKKGQILKSSHMPVREGKMGCESCHNPHGSGNPKMLKAGSVNDLCYSCHAEKRGPFVWEHAPVRENCSNCHDPHGSNNPKMLTSKGPFLCTNCHQYGGHVNVPRYNRQSALFGQGCINCHSRIHGSNHPSGAKFTR